MKSKRVYRKLIFFPEFKYRNDTDSVERHSTNMSVRCVLVCDVCRILEHSNSSLSIPCGVWLHWRCTNTRKKMVVTRLHSHTQSTIWYICVFIVNDDCSHSTQADRHYYLYTVHELHRNVRWYHPIWPMYRHHAHQSHRHNLNTFVVNKQMTRPCACSQMPLLLMSLRIIAYQKMIHTMQKIALVCILRWQFQLPMHSHDMFVPNAKWAHQYALNNIIWSSRWAFCQTTT